MRVLIVSTAVLSLMAGVATTAGAQTVKQFQLVGFTEGAAVGGAGVLEFSRMCQQEFEASRMCTSAEVGQTVELPEILGDDRAWVLPSPQPRSHTDDQWTCSGWSASGGTNNGLVVTPSGQFHVGAECNTPRPVACCSLLRVPEPSTLLLQGAAAATLGTLAAKRTPRAIPSTEPPT
jgi:hypothetical protein